MEGSYFSFVFDAVQFPVVNCVCTVLHQHETWNLLGSMETGMHAVDLLRGTLHAEMASGTKNQDL